MPRTGCGGPPQWREPPGGAHKLTSSGELEELFRGPDQARPGHVKSLDGGDAKEGKLPPMHNTSIPSAEGCALGLQT